MVDVFMCSSLFMPLIVYVSDIDHQSIYLRDDRCSKFNGPFNVYENEKKKKNV